ncbi:hypothetical protein WJX81_000795 [Elliptochloris bilobata]|uniref:cellulase n=1 Tax=Elliptochloris bilobata TaxID=381761 RepID=A0AAW1QIL4_9CHLO
MPVSLVEYLLCENGLQHHAPAFANLSEESFRGLLMQDYGKYGVVAMQDKQKLFRLIRKLSAAEPAVSPPRKSMPSSAVLQAVCASSLEASRLRAQALDGDAALLDLEDADVDFFSQAQAQEAAPSGYSHQQAGAGGEGRAHAQSWSGAEAPAYAQTGFRSAAAEFVERSDPPKIRVVVRKRPLNQKEVERGEEDAVEVDMADARLVVNEPRSKVDLTRYVERHAFSFDDALDAAVSNDAVYRSTVQPLVATIFKAGKATCFAYGQTGSGKTYTMQPLPLRAAADMFALLADPQFADLSLWVSCFEIYGGKLYDLLNGRARLEMREDGRKRVCIVGLKEVEVSRVTTIQQLVDHSNAARSTGSTGANADSSRSHSIMQFALKRRGEGEVGRQVGKISFIDLAGSERGADTCDNDRQTRLEGAEINKSLLALKECIRALDSVARHVPFRGSKLTEVLRDSFVGEQARTVMIANVSPSSACCEHTLNTLRYADRVKELRKERGARLPGSVTPGPIGESGSAYQFPVLPELPPAPPLARPIAPSTDPRVQPFGTATGCSVSPMRSGRAPSPLRAPSPNPGPPSPGQAGQGLRAPPSPPQALQSLAQGLQAPRDGRRSPAPGSRSPLQRSSELRQTASPPRARAGLRRSMADDVGWRRSGSDAGGRPTYYDDAGEEAGALLYERDELMERILEEEDALIAAHRSQIEDTMAIVRQEMNLLGEVDQPGSAIDVYVDRLGAILARKAAGIAALQRRLDAVCWGALRHSTVVAGLISGKSRFAEEAQQPQATPLLCKAPPEASWPITPAARRGLRPGALPPSAWDARGIAAYTAFLTAAGAYFWLRAEGVRAMGLYAWYGALVLAGEALGACSVALYGLCIIRRALPPPAHDLQRATEAAADQPFHVQVLVPCYTEALDIVAESVWAAHVAQVPAGCAKTVWLLDDGKDADKAAWVAGLGAGDAVRYLAGRKRPKDEVNGKAGNLNHALRKIHPRGLTIAPGEVVAVFDCDQVCDADFFMRTLPLLRESPSIALVLTPQRFGNVAEEADVFNHSNRHFWEVLIPGLAAWGMAVCTGSNLVLRASALMEVGGFPGRTITEDYALGMELNKAGYGLRYLPAYLATGEAPEEGAIFRQRSRWCKGHMQAFLSRDCPLLQHALPARLRLLFAAGTLSYAAAAVTTPLFAAVPVVAVTAGVFPLALTPRLVAAAVPYFLAQHAVVYHCGSWSLLRALWFGAVATHVLWFTYAKAVWNTSLWAAGLKHKGRFKTTIKTGVLTGTPRAAGTPRGFGGAVEPLSYVPSAERTPAPGTPTQAHESPAAAGAKATFERHLLQHRFSAVWAAAVAASGAPPPVATRSLPVSPRCAQPPPSPVRSLGGSVSRTSSIAMPELQKQLTEGVRPGWNLELAAAASSSSSQAASFAGLVVRNISCGTLRDLWAPLLVLLLSAGAAVCGAWRLAWQGQRSAALAASVLWAVHNCIGPYLLAHYTWVGRGRSLARAAAVAAALTLAILAAALACLVALAPATYDYGQVLHYSYEFYEAQRSGALPPGSGPAWRGDSALSDTAPSGTPLVGGWYDAGDHLKTSFSIGIAASLMAWGILEFPQGHERAGATGRAHASLRWAADYLMACHTAPNEFVGQVGDMEEDHGFWGRPEDMLAADLRRPAFVVNATHPGSDLAAQAAAALAAVSRVFAAEDPGYAARALGHARQLYAFASAHRGSFAASVPAMGAVYPSPAYRDDLAWAAGWLYAATREADFLRDAHAALAESRREEPERWTYFASNWANMLWNAQMLLARVSGDAAAAASVRDYLERWREGRVVRYTRRGLAYADDWGTLRNAANSALLALVYARHTPDSAPALECWAQSQLRYMLGDGRRSFVVGYGRRPPARPHHRAASCAAPPAPCNFSALHTRAPNPHVLRGALVGGPHPDDSFADERSEYAKSEVGIEYSAGFTAALAGAAQSQGCAVSTW